MSPAERAALRELLAALEQITDVPIPDASKDEWKYRFLLSRRMSMANATLSVIGSDTWVPMPEGMRAVTEELRDWAAQTPVDYPVYQPAQAREEG